MILLAALPIRVLAFSTPPDAGAFSWLVVLTLLALSSLAVNLMTLIRGKNQKRDVTILQDSVGNMEFKEFQSLIAQQRDDSRLEMSREIKAVVEKFEALISDLWRTIREERAATDAAQLANQEKILSRIGELQASLGELRGKLTVFMEQAKNA